MKSTRGLALFTSIISSSLIAVSLSVGAPTAASAAEDDSLNACYPPGRGGAACLAEEHSIVEVKKTLASDIPLPRATAPATESARRQAIDKLKRDSEPPVRLSTSVIIGGKPENLNASVTAKTGKGNVVVGTKLGATTRIKAGPYAPGSAGGFIQVWLSTSDKIGMEDLGHFTTDENGYFLLPAVTLTEGGIATFILREECNFSGEERGCLKKKKAKAAAKRPTKANQTPQVSFKYAPGMITGGTLKVDKRTREPILDTQGRRTYTTFRFKYDSFIYDDLLRKWLDYTEGTTSNSKLIGRSILSLIGR